MSDSRLHIIRELESKRDIDGLLAAMDRQDDWKIPVEACKALGRIGGEKAVDGLMIALYHHDRSVREKAADALGEIGDARALESLVAVARDDPDLTPRWLAAVAMGQIGGPQAIEELVALIKLPNYTPHEGAAAGLVKAGAEAVEPLIAALEGSLGIGAREKAEEALTKIDDPRGTAWLSGQAAQEARDAQPAEGLLEFVLPKQWKEGIGQGAEAYQAALTHWNAKRYDQALERYKAAVGQGLTSLYEAAARSNMGQIYLKQENVELAVKEFREGLTLHFMTASTAYSLAVHLVLIYEVLGKQDEMQQAVAICQDALKRIDTIMTAEAAEDVRETVRRAYQEG